jgi:endonuclease/exonuclease/phosphatase (EEP) superfamily protein YafD
VLLAAAAFGLLLGRFAWLWIAFDIFNHFAWHLAIVVAAAGVALFLPRWRTRSAIVLAVAGFLAISLVALTWGRRSGASEPLAPAERALKVMSFNTWLSNTDWRAVADEIERADPDVAVLLELGPEKTAALEALAPRYPHRLDCLAISFCNLAIVSKLPLIEGEAHTRWLGPPYIRAEVGEGEGRLTVFGIHTIRPPHFWAQRKQMQAIAEVVASTPGARLVAGDFNATPMSHMLEIFAAASGLHRLTRTPSWPASFGPFPQIAIDHIFVSDGVRLISGPVIGNNAGSDHYPVIATIAVPAGVGE